MAPSAAQLLQQLHGPGRGLHHVQLAHPGQLHDLAGGDHADHRVAIVAARLQIGQDRGDVLFDEQQVGDDDIAVAHGIARFFQRLRVLRPFGGGMDRHAQTRETRPPAAPTRAPPDPPRGCPA
jgi:hypothetical protein